MTKRPLNFLQDPVAKKESYAFGWYVTRRDWGTGPILNHLGSNTMFYSACWAAPADGFAVVAATNCGTEAGSQACDQAAAKMIEKVLHASEDR